MAIMPFDQALSDPTEGWKPYWFPETHPALNWLHIEIWRREWPGPKIVSQAEMHPAMNVYDLYWRPV